MKAAVSEGWMDGVADAVAPRAGGVLLLQSFRGRWDLGHAPNLRQLRGYAHYARHSLAHLPRQLNWLRFLDGAEAMRQAVRADPGLYGRWHRPFMSRELGPDARMRLLQAHYRFLLERFPPRLRDKLLRGHDVRIGTLRLRDGTPVHLHLRKPAVRAMGELGLYLVSNDKEVLSSCSFTFGGEEGLLIGAIQGAWSFLGRNPIRAFTRGSHGVRPKTLLLTLVRVLARLYGIERLRGVAKAAHPFAAQIHADYDAFWRENGGVPGEDGFYELPRFGARRPIRTLPSKHRAARRRREQFLDEARAVFLRAMDWRVPTAPAPSPSAESVRRAAREAAPAAGLGPRALA
ncbi:DUF535 family protein [Dyella sp. BiH032]|uniref:DUF535 family protein n=1 Tax=Dyella sp. BiH032 TaxID=3075430 RepID=UPI0028936023|nr:DUF535 family protein [Dyella sp. BiH032]WNL44134.1 DUF535 family protein [Dyella sp. BiH032]